MYPAYAAIANHRDVEFFHNNLQEK